MSISKTLSSAVAALSIVGAVGIAYAQTTPDATTAPAPASTSPSPSPSSTTTTTTTDTMVAPSTDLEPRADRN